MQTLHALHVTYVVCCTHCMSQDMRAANTPHALRGTHGVQTLHGMLVLQSLHARNALRRACVACYMLCMKHVVHLAHIA